jgi:hypothetical protein
MIDNVFRAIKFFSAVTATVQSLTIKAVVQLV